MVLMYHVPVHLPNVSVLLAGEDVTHKCFLQYDITSVSPIFQNLADCLATSTFYACARILPVRYFIYALSQNFRLKVFSFYTSPWRVNLQVTATVLPVTETEKFAYPDFRL